MSLENIRGVIRKIDYTLTEDEIDDWCEECRYAIQTETYDFSSFSREVYSQSGKKRVIYSFPKLSVENMLSHYLKQQLDRAFHIKYASRRKIINLLFNTLVATKNMNDFVIVRADFKSFFDSVKSEYVYEKYILPSIIKREDKQLLENSLISSRLISIRSKASISFFLPSFPELFFSSCFISSGTIARFNRLE